MKEFTRLNQVWPFHYTTISLSLSPGLFVELGKSWFSWILNWNILCFCLNQILFHENKAYASFCLCSYLIEPDHGKVPMFCDIFFSLHVHHILVLKSWLRALFSGFSSELYCKLVNVNVHWHLIHVKLEYIWQLKYCNSIEVKENVMFFKALFGGEGLQVKGFTGEWHRWYERFICVARGKMDSRN